jgi:hypothetical protein
MNRSAAGRFPRVLGVWSIACAVLLLATEQTAHAAGMVGMGTAASCTDAVLNEALAGGGLVTFNCGGGVTIDISTGRGTKMIAADTIIDGGGLITISGGNSVGVFVVNAGVQFTVESLTIANGSAAGGGFYNNFGPTSTPVRRCLPWSPPNCCQSLGSAGVRLSSMPMAVALLRSGRWLWGRQGAALARRGGPRRAPCMARAREIPRRLRSASTRAKKASSRHTRADRCAPASLVRSSEPGCGRSSARRDLAVLVSSPGPAAPPGPRLDPSGHDRPPAHGHRGRTSTIRGVRSEVVVGTEAGLKQPSAINLYHW